MIKQCLGSSRTKFLSFDVQWKAGKWVRGRLDESTKEISLLRSLLCGMNQNGQIVMLQVQDFLERNDELKQSLLQLKNKQKELFGEEEGKILACWTDNCCQKRRFVKDTLGSHCLVLCDFFHWMDRFKEWMLDEKNNPLAELFMTQLSKAIKLVGDDAWRYLEERGLLISTLPQTQASKEMNEQNKSRWKTQIDVIPDPERLKASFNKLMEKWIKHDEEARDFNHQVQTTWSSDVAQKVKEAESNLLKKMREDGNPDIDNVTLSAKEIKQIERNVVMQEKRPVLFKKEREVNRKKVFFVRDFVANQLRHIELGCLSDPIELGEPLFFENADGTLTTCRGTNKLENFFRKLKLAFKSQSTCGVGRADMLFLENAMQRSDLVVKKLSGDKNHLLHSREFCLMANSFYSPYSNSLRADEYPYPLVKGNFVNPDSVQFGFFKAIPVEDDDSNHSSVVQIYSELVGDLDASLSMVPTSEIGTLNDGRSLERALLGSLLTHLDGPFRQRFLAFLPKILTGGEDLNSSSSDLLDTLVELDGASLEIFDSDSWRERAGEFFLSAEDVLLGQQESVLRFLFSFKAFIFRAALRFCNCNDPASASWFAKCQDILCTLDKSFLRRNNQRTEDTSRDDLVRARLEEHLIRACGEDIQAIDAAGSHKQWQRQLLVKCEVNAERSRVFLSLCSIVLYRCLRIKLSIKAVSSTGFYTYENGRYLRDLNGSWVGTGPAPETTEVAVLLEEKLDSSVPSSQTRALFSASYTCHHVEERTLTPPPKASPTSSLGLYRSLRGIEVIPQAFSMDKPYYLERVIFYRLLRSRLAKRGVPFLTRVFNLIVKHYTEQRGTVSDIRVSLIPHRQLLRPKLEEHVRRFMTKCQAFFNKNFRRVVRELKSTDHRPISSNASSAPEVEQPSSVNVEVDSEAPGLVSETEEWQIHREFFVADYNIFEELSDAFASIRELGGEAFPGQELGGLSVPSRTVQGLELNLGKARRAPFKVHSSQDSLKMKINFKVVCSQCGRLNIDHTGYKFGKECVLSRDPKAHPDIAAPKTSAEQVAASIIRSSVDRKRPRVADTQPVEPQQNTRRRFGHLCEDPRWERLVALAGRNQQPVDGRFGLCQLQGLGHNAHSFEVLDMCFGGVLIASINFMEVVRRPMARLVEEPSVLGGVECQDVGVLLSTRNDSQAWLSDKILVRFLRTLQYEDFISDFQSALKWSFIIPFGTITTSTVHIPLYTWRSECHGLDASLILAPHIEGLHWRLLGVYPTRKRIILLDSMKHGSGPLLPGTRSYSLCEEIHRNLVHVEGLLERGPELVRLIDPDLSSWTVEHVACPQQGNVVDCGAIVLMNAAHLRLHADPNIPSTYCSCCLRGGIMHKILEHAEKTLFKDCYAFLENVSDNSGEIVTLSP